jgi:hypothetical protein
MRTSHHLTKHHKRMQPAYHPSETVLMYIFVLEERNLCLSRRTRHSLGFFQHRDLVGLQERLSFLSWVCVL